MVLDREGYYSRKPIFARQPIRSAKPKPNDGAAYIRPLAPREPQERIDRCLSCTLPEGTCKGSDRCKLLKEATA